MRHILVFAVLVAAIGCGEDARVDTIVALDGDATNGESLYTAQCVPCHGADGTGGSEPESIAGEASDPSGTAQIILKGEDSMAAYEDVFSDQEIADIIAFMRSW